MVDLTIEMTIRDAFDGDTVYSLTEERRPDGTTSYRVRRDLSGSVQHLRLGGSPIAEHAVDPVEVEQMIATLEAVRIAPYPTFAAGLDGTTTTVTITRGCNSVKFTWWGDLPERWAGLRVVLEFFQECFPS